MVFSTLEFPKAFPTVVFNFFFNYYYLSIVLSVKGMQDGQERHALKHTACGISFAVITQRRLK